jgi:hypothetical protein
MLVRRLYVLVAAIMILLGGPSLHAGEKVEICHIPPDNPSDRHTIFVSVNALAAHLAHGDTTGPCEDSCDAASSCDDGNLCTEDICDVGFCQFNDISAYCDDGDPCTLNSCDPLLGCVDAPLEGDPCDDGDSCTDWDQCSSSGACVGTSVEGCCQIDADCNDQNLCTEDLCSIPLGSDGGSCSHTEITCESPHECDVATCVPNEGCRLAALSCDDNNETTLDYCDPTSGCVNVVCHEVPPDNDGDGSWAWDGDGPDCDDANAAVYPYAEEICDGLDNDCNGVVDDRDVDLDSFRSSDCGGQDCDDLNHSVNPAATELCDGIDNNCDGQVDEDCGIDDIDEDGFNALVDCDDLNPNIYPGALEICNGEDENCDSLVDEGPATVLCPPGPFVASTACAGAAGCALTCSPQWSDFNGLFVDGCECQQIDLEPNDSCLTPVDLGVLNANTENVLTVEGNISPAEDADWYMVFIQDQPSTYPDNVDSLKIYFENNAVGRFHFEVYRGGCPGFGMLGPCDHTNDVNCWSCGEPNINDSSYYYIKVMGDYGTPPPCDETYVLSIRTQALSAGPGCEYCGDNSCGLNESVSRCAEDCAICGDNTCSSPVEDTDTCAEDCATCGDGTCSPITGETIYTCAADCAVCGDGVCSPGGGEDRYNCQADCGSCGDGFCSSIRGEDKYTCQSDCGWCGDGICGPGEHLFNCGVDCHL